MALRFNNTLNDRATFSGEAGLGSSNTHTTLVWFRREANDTGAEVLVLSTATSTYQLKLTATGIQTYSALGASGSASQSLNTYYCLAIVRSGALFSAYQWDTAGARTDIATDLDTTVSNNCTGLRLGDSGGAYTAPRASYRYLRHWSRALSLSELLAEVQFTPSGTGALAAASTTNLRGSWGLPDGTTTTDWSGNANSLTINSGSTSTDEPSIPSGGASVAITSVSDSDVYNGQTGIVITGTGFGATETGSAAVIISPTDNVADASAVTQDATSWSDTSVQFTAARGSLAYNTTMYLFVKESGGTSNASGTAISFHEVVTTPLMGQAVF